MLEHAIEARKDFLQPIPKYYCESCKRCINKFCTFFERYVITDYNKCFNHSNYSPVHSKYNTPANLVEIVTEQELRKTA